jgi:hypothetical protein
MIVIHGQHRRKVSETLSHYVRWILWHTSVIMAMQQGGFWSEASQAKIAITFVENN